MTRARWYQVVCCQVVIPEGRDWNNLQQKFLSRGPYQLTCNLSQLDPFIRSPAAPVVQFKNGHHLNADAPILTSVHQDVLRVFAILRVFSTLSLSQQRLEVHEVRRVHGCGPARLLFSVAA